MHRISQWQIASAVIVIHVGDGQVPDGFVFRPVGSEDIEVRVNRLAQHLPFFLPTGPRIVRPHGMPFAPVAEAHHVIQNHRAARFVVTVTIGRKKALHFGEIESLPGRIGVSRAALLDSALGLVFVVFDADIPEPVRASLVAWRAGPTRIRGHPEPDHELFVAGFPVIHHGVQILPIELAFLGLQIGPHPVNENPTEQGGVVAKALGVVLDVEWPTVIEPRPGPDAPAAVRVDQRIIAFVGMHSGPFRRTRLRCGVLDADETAIGTLHHEAALLRVGDRLPKQIQILESHVPNGMVGQAHDA